MAVWLLDTDTSRQELELLDLPRIGRCDVHRGKESSRIRFLYRSRAKLDPRLRFQMGRAPLLEYLVCERCGPAILEHFQARGAVEAHLSQRGGSDDGAA